MADNLNFKDFRIPTPPPNTKAFEEYRAGTMQWRGTIRGWLRKGAGWPTVVRGFRFLRLSASKSK